MVEPMSRLPNRKLMTDESGATALEYGLITVLITFVTLASLKAVGVTTVSFFESTSESVTAASEGN